MPVALSKKDAAYLARRRLERRYEAIGLFIGRGFKWGFFAFLAWQARIAIQALAGQTTLANIVLALGANVSIVIARVIFRLHDRGCPRLTLKDGS